MLRPDDLWLLGEVEEEPSELLKVLPEIRQYLMPARREEDLGLRALIEEPEAVMHCWRNQAGRRVGNGALRPRAA